MNKTTELFKTLSDETRLRILMLLYHKKLCVCQLQGIMEESQPKISKHLSKLKDRGLVKDAREEQFIFYYLNKDNKLLEEILKMLLTTMEDEGIMKNDLEQLKDADTYINDRRKQASEGKSKE